MRMILTRIGVVLAVVLPSIVQASQSVCRGTTARGSLEDGVKLPLMGSNFTAYSTLAWLAGRTYVHSEVRAIVLAAYAELNQTMPKTVYKYAETGNQRGGRFKPHKTHQNGLSVDFMTPMKTADGKSVHLPTYPWNRLGYDIELDDKGSYRDLSIDYDALAAHISALDRAAKARGHRLWRVIFDPELQLGLFASEHGRALATDIQLSTKRSWVRHDEHYHVDFVVPCEL